RARPAPGRRRRDDELLGGDVRPVAQHDGGIPRQALARRSRTGRGGERTLRRWKGPGGLPTIRGAAETPACDALREVALAEAERDVSVDDVDRLAVHVGHVPVVLLLVTRAERPA